jgi:hypothetical protein
MHRNQKPTLEYEDDTYEQQLYGSRLKLPTLVFSWMDLILFWNHK